MDTGLAGVEPELGFSKVTELYRFTILNNVPSVNRPETWTTERTPSLGIGIIVNFSKVQSLDFNSYRNVHNE